MSKQIPKIAYNNTGFFFNMAVKYKYSPGQKITFTYKDKVLTGVVRGLRDGDEPKYLIWVQDKYGWVRESVLSKILIHQKSTKNKKTTT